MPEGRTNGFGFLANANFWKIAIPLAGIIFTAGGLYVGYQNLTNQVTALQEKQDTQIALTKKAFYFIAQRLVSNSDGEPVELRPLTVHEMELFGLLPPSQADGRTP